jgi:glycerophosphoryl diester phosphodiesterase
MQILSHRANACGPDALAENSPASVRTALYRGWGLELDIRRTHGGTFYFSHDPRPESVGAGADAICAAIRAYPSATVAMNVKEIGYERELIAYLDQQGILDQVVLFDMELLESVPGRTANLFRYYHSTVRIAARVSDRGESLDRALGITPASVVWLDEFDMLWAGEADIRQLRAAGRQVYAVAPDLHGAQFPMTRERCVEFARWGVDAVCTDYPASVQRVLDQEGLRVAA